MAIRILQFKPSKDYLESVLLILKDSLGLVLRIGSKKDLKLISQIGPKLFLKKEGLFLMSENQINGKLLVLLILQI